MAEELKERRGCTIASLRAAIEPAAKRLQLIPASVGKHGWMITSHVKHKASPLPPAFS